jgi:hypothetical protein
MAKDTRTHFKSINKNYGLIVAPIRRTLVDGQAFVSEGKKVQFLNGYYATDDVEMIKALRKDPDYCKAYHEVCPEDIQVDNKLREQVANVTTLTQRKGYACNGCGATYSSPTQLEMHKSDGCPGGR